MALKQEALLLSNEQVPQQMKNQTLMEPQGSSHLHENFEV
jgi:hypothetical protein